MRTLIRIHKWVSILIGIQVLLWLISGLFFNLMDGNKAAGKTYRQPPAAAIRADLSTLIEPKTILQAYPDTLALKQTTLLEQHYYLLTHVKGLYPHFINRYSLVNARTGEKTDIDQEFAVRLAEQSYSGNAPVESVHFLDKPEQDFPKQQNPVWQINFADDINTRVYIERDSGRIVGHSDDHKRLADFFFVLHFMDYNHSGSFNTWQMMLAACLMLGLSVTGVLYLFKLLGKGRFRLGAR